MKKHNKMNERIGWVDLAKGIGIVLVIMGHTITSDLFSLYLHAFHMPYFFLISGYLIKSTTNKTPCEFVKGKARALLIPYVTFGLFTYLVWVFLYQGDIATGKESLWMPLLHLLWINSTGLKISGEFWFLTALFCSVLAFDFLRRKTSKIIMMVAIVFLSVFGSYFRFLFDIQLPWSILSGCTGLGFIYAGYSLRNEENSVVNHLLNLKWYEMTLLLLAEVFLVKYNGEVNMRRSLYNNVGLFYFNAMSISVVLLNICKRIDRWSNSNRIGLFMRDIGENSITYVCLDSMVIKICHSILRRYVILPESGIILLCWDLLLVVVVVGLLYIINRIINKTKLRCFLGK